MSPAKKKWRPFEDAREYARSLGLKSYKEWVEFGKSGQRPPDIPGKPNDAYQDDGWVGWPDWLGTIGKKTSRKDWRPFPEARKYARSLGLKGKNAWVEWSASGQRPDDIPGAPYQVYNGDGWVNWIDWLGTTNRLRDVVWRPFPEARKYARSLGLKSYKEWVEFAKSDQRPSDIPATPNKIYQNDGWVHWPDWLGTDSKSSKRPRGVDWRPFEDARKYARSLGLKSNEEWVKWSASGQKPPDIPSDPNRVYKGKGWINTRDWLGTKQPEIWRPFPEAREYARSLGLKGQKAWVEWSTSGERPPDIPGKPNDAYKDDGWVSMPDWLGTDSKSRKTPVDGWRLFEDAREYARSLGLKRTEEWDEWSASLQRPPDIPSDPNRVYEDKGWVSWPDWLGHNPRKWHRKALLGFIEDLRPAWPHLTEEQRITIIDQAGAMPKLREHFNKASIGEVMRDMTVNEGRGIEEAILNADEEDFDDEAADEAAGDETLNGSGKAVDAAFTEHNDSLPAPVTADGLRAVNNVFSRYCNPDSEAAEFIVRCDVARLWDAYAKGEDVEAVLEADGDYARSVRGRFTEELAGVKALPVPEGWSFTANGKPAQPFPMQMRTAWEVLNKHRVGNWSGTGAGKTGSAAITSRAIDAQVTLIVAANPTIERVWLREVAEMFPDSVIHTHVPAAIDRARHNYIVLNYEKFQLLSTRTLIEQLIGLGVDFVVLDEVQKAKQRNRDASKRRKNLEGLMFALSENNPDLCVLGMSATPVINNLVEAVKLLELISGRSFEDLSTVATVQNALAVRRSLLLNGFRYRPDYETKVNEERIPVNGNHLLDDLKAVRTPLQMEQALLPAKLEAMLPYVRKGTLIYTHYVSGMVPPMRDYLERRGLNVGIYTGGDKSGLDDFLNGKVDVLIGSDPVGTGLDGLQTVCDRIIAVSLPWTAAEWKQLEGRIVREGSVFDEVSVVVPQVVLDYHGDEWSWDRSRMAVIEHKRTLADCAVDGRIPDSVMISQGKLFKRDKGYLDAWAARLAEESPYVIERSKLTVPLPPDIKEKVMARRGGFTEINNCWASSDSSTVHDRLRSNPDEWYLYHTLYRKHRAKWAEIPAERIAQELRDRPDMWIGDFGCGENLLKDALPNHEVVGMDHVAYDESVLACDIADTPLEDSSLDAAVFSLSLMGHNWIDYLDEAHRTLRPLGLLFIAEPSGASKWEGGRLEQAVEHTGFKVVSSNQRYEFKYLLAMKAN